MRALDNCLCVVDLHFLALRVSLLHLICIHQCALSMFFLSRGLVSSLRHLPLTGGQGVLVAYLSI